MFSGPMFKTHRGGHVFFSLCVISANTKRSNTQKKWKR